MASKSRVVISIVGDASKLDRETSKAEGRLKRFGSAVGKIGKIMGPLAAVGGAMAAFSFGKDATLEAQRLNSALANTRQILKQTEGAAGRTLGQLRGNAKDLQFKIGVDDKEILETQNVLLTFTGVAGKQFDRATSLAYDMSAVLGTNASGAALQLGKALNDPVKGISSLSRAGVQFTDQQKEQIKALVESGQTVKAQKVILGELEHQMGGTAAASADSTKKLGVLWGDVKEKVGGVLISTIDKMTPAILAFGQKVLPKIGQAMSRVGAVIGPILASLGNWFSTQWPAISAAFMAGAQRVSGWFSQIAQTIRTVWPQIQQIVSGVVQNITAAIQTYGPQIIAMWQALFGAVQAIIQTVVTVVSALWQRFGQHLLQHLQTAFNAIKQVLGGAIQMLTGIFDFVKAILTGKWGEAWDAVKQILEGAWNIILGVLKAALNAVSTALGAAVAVISQIWSGAWNGIKAVYSAVWRAITGAIRNYISTVHSIISGALDVIKAVWSGAWNAVKSVVSGIWDGIRSTVQRGVDGVRNVFSGMWDGVGNGARAVFNGIAAAWNSTVGQLSFTVPSWVPGIGGNTFAAPRLPTYHTGGIVPGSGEQVAKVLGGEGVFTKDQMAAIGRGLESQGTGTGASGRPIVVNLVLDGRVMASQMLPGIRAAELGAR